MSHFRGIIRFRGNAPRQFHRVDLATGLLKPTAMTFATLSPDNPDHLAQLGQIHARQGQRDAAHQVIARLKQLTGTRYVPAYDLALVHAALGERDSAFEWLQRAYDERYGPIVFLRVDPDIDSVRDDPRFDALVAQVRLRPTT